MILVGFLRFGNERIEVADTITRTRITITVIAIDTVTVTTTVGAAETAAIFQDIST